MNSVTLVGRVGRVGDFRYSQAGNAMISFSIAVERYNSEEPDWFNVVCFNKSAEFFRNYIDRGARVGVEGRLQQQRYTTEAGENRSSVQIVASSVQSLESRVEAEARRSGRSGKEGSQQHGAPPAAAEQTAAVAEQKTALAQQTAQQPPASQPEQQAPNPFDEIDDEDDPFRDM